VREAERLPLLVLTQPLRFPWGDRGEDAHHQLADRRRGVGADVQQMDDRAAGEPGFQRGNRIAQRAKGTVEHGDADVVAGLDGRVQCRTGRPVAHRVAQRTDRLVPVHLTDDRAAGTQPVLLGDDPLQLGF
jgi:hypothetical protein